MAYGAISALTWWVKEVGPELDKGISNVVLYVIGKHWATFQSIHLGVYGKYCRFLGFLKFSDMLQVIDSSRVFVSPMLSATGISTMSILAMTRGIPLVTTPSGATGLCEKCDEVLLQVPYDLFAEKPSSREMPLLVGRGMYDVVAQVKRFYYDKNTWEEYALNGPIHARSWFSKMRGVEEIEAMLSLLSTLPHISNVTAEAEMIEREETERFVLSKYG